MRRRAFITLLGGAAAFPLAARGQQSGKVYRLGFLTTTSGPAPGHAALETALARLGYQEGKNLVIERRYASGNLGRLPDLATELVRAGIDVIVTQSTPAAQAAKQATARIPIVMATGGDALGSGLVASLARPGGNVTGMTFMGTELAAKRFELLCELKPDARRLAFVGNMQITPERLTFEVLQRLSAAIGIEAAFVSAPMPEAFEAAFAMMAANSTDVIFVPESSLNTEARRQLAALAARHRLPAIYGRREFVEAGGLLSYGTSLDGLFRRAADFVDKIFKGASPADLPVEQPTTFELIINLKTAKALGLTVPPTLLGRADEVIE